MRGNLMIGMIAGSVIGMTAAMIAMPYFQPKVQQVIRKGRKVINTHMDKMESGS